MAWFWLEIQRNQEFCYFERKTCSKCLHLQNQGHINLYFLFVYHSRSNFPITSHTSRRWFPSKNPYGDQCMAYFQFGFQQAISKSYWEIACLCDMKTWWNKQFHENVLIHRSGTVGFWSGSSIASTLTSPVSWVWRSWLTPLGVWLDSVDSPVPQRPPKIWVSFKVKEKGWKQNRV